MDYGPKPMVMSNLIVEKSVTVCEEILINECPEERGRVFSGRMSDELPFKEILSEASEVIFI